MERSDFEQWRPKEVARLLALVETEKRYYQEIVAALPAPLAVLAADRSIVFVNRAFRRRFEVRTADLRGKLIEQVIPSPELIERIRDAHMHGASQPLGIDVGGRPVRLYIIPLPSGDDETEAETLLMLEEAPAAAPARAASAPPDVPAILWQADSRNRTFLSVTGAAEQMLGYPVSHWLATPQFFRERIHPDDRPAAMALYDAAVERKGDAAAEFRIVTASGASIWCRESIRVTPKGISGVLTNIDQRKQLEQQGLAAERADALHAISGRLAHDLNNPLMIVTGYAEELLQSLKPEDPMRKDVQQILDATERIAGITAQLLGFTRKLANQPQPLDVLALIDAVEDKIASGEPIQVTVAPGDPVWAMADAGQLQDVILTLTSSEREGAKERSRIDISFAAETIAEQGSAALAPGVYACITIRDNGRGTTAKVFENIVSKDPHGSAMAQAYSTIRAWGGDIAFSSAARQGSTFKIYLPVAEAGSAAPAPRQPAPTKPAAPARQTILLVEDEAGIRALVRKILRRENYVLLEAGSAEEALNIAGAHEGRIDLLLTDVMLPGIGGRELAEGLREWLPNLKILYVSGFTSDEEIRRGLPPGSKFLQKPFTLNSLLAKVREALAS